MLDFFDISYRERKKGIIEIYPRFKITKSNDLMIRGGDFYAVWREDLGRWSTDEQDAIQLIDNELDRYARDNREKLISKLQTELGSLGMDSATIRVMHLWDAGTRMIASWHQYCQKDMRDSYHMLDEKLIFSNTKTDKRDYSSKSLNYPLEDGDISAYDELMSVLYSNEERQKIEWAIGSVVSGDSKKIQKFIVLYGAAGTGKSTVLNIIQQLFDGYCAVFDAKALGSSSNEFALEAFKSNPLVAIQHDGDLSRIEDNTRLNSLVSHELMTVNEKFKSTYSNRFKAFLFIGTNKPVKITDAKSGLIRRLIDVSPTGKKLNIKTYKSLMEKIGFELGAIAWHCQNVYLENPNLYDDYIPTLMLGASNDFYNFVIDSYDIFKESDGVTLKSAWSLYREYCEDAKVAYPYSQRLFKEELKNYFLDFKEREVIDGVRVRNYYKGFKLEGGANELYSPVKYVIDFNEFNKSIFDKECADCPAQYADEEGKPKRKWQNVSTKLSDLNTRALHYVKVPENHIVIDFDIKNSDGKKDFTLNLEEASKFPATYAELSKSGSGIHLHYIYDGDVSKLSNVYAENIEIKVFKGNSSLRRMLTKCNNLPISKIGSGLPTKGDKKMLDIKQIKSEKGLRTLIFKNLNKEIHPGTKPSVDFIKKILDEAYESGLSYNVEDLKPAILSFAANSTNHWKYCYDLALNNMKYKSKEASGGIKKDSGEIIFFDTEVFPNLLLVNWKLQGEGRSVVRMINPKPEEIEELIKHKLVGFNCRRYDNHILYARLMGYSNEALYELSKSIIAGNRNAFFGEAYDISYTDVYDFSSKKQSLKKFEIELGIHHQELGIPWDKPVPENLWPKVAEYCDNDVIATEAVFNARTADFTAREILAVIANGTVNDTTNQLTAKIIFGNEKHPQNKFNYRNLGDDSGYIHWPLEYDEFTAFNTAEQPIFPGYEYKNGKSTYRGEETGEGGYVYAEPGMHYDVALLDIASMHPSSVIAENLFGAYTNRFKDLVDLRILIKHKEFNKARQIMNGAFAAYLKDEQLAKDLAYALKIAINSVYGLTSASFENPFKDPRNIDNIVAKRGALFMINLKHEVQKQGYTVAHIKTDSIKIPNADKKIIDFVTSYGKLYGYSFEHEATYERMCLVNDAVYIARDSDGKWEPTGKQFAVPYVFKTLFSGEEIWFDDKCETFAVTKGDLYLDKNESLPDVSEKEKAFTKAESDYRKGLLSDTTFEKTCNELQPEIEKGHDYKFVGKVGRFCPVQSGCGGGVLYRQSNGKSYSPPGAKGYRWLEAEEVKNRGLDDKIDTSYYEKLVDAAKNTIEKYGNYEEFVH